MGLCTCVLCRVDMQRSSRVLPQGRILGAQSEVGASSTAALNIQANQVQLLPHWNEFVDSNVASNASLQSDLNELGMLAREMLETQAGRRFMERSNEIMTNNFLDFADVFSVVKFCFENAKKFIANNPKVCIAITLALAMMFVDLWLTNGRYTIPTIGPIFQQIWSLVQQLRV